MRDHGTRARYVHGPDENDQPGRPCRCDDCREANRVAQAAGRHRRLLEKWGAEPPSMVDAEPVRAHVRELQAAGIGWKRVAAAAGVTASTVGKLLGYNGGPSRWVRPKTAQRILAVTVDGTRADGALVDAAGTRRRIQALMAAGHTMSAIGRHLDIAPTNMSAMLLKRPHVTERRAREVRDLYERLWDQPPPAATRGQRSAATRARATARRNGWPPPAGWDDDLIDLTEEELAAELARRVEAMDLAELAAAHTAYYKHRDISPLVVAAARSYQDRRREQVSA